MRAVVILSSMSRALLVWFREFVRFVINRGRVWCCPIWVTMGEVRWSVRFLMWSGED